MSKIARKLFILFCHQNRYDYHRNKRTNVRKSEYKVGRDVPKALGAVRKGLGKGENQGGGEYPLWFSNAEENDDKGDPALAGRHSGNERAEVQA